MEQVTIVGLGLIGASLGLALKQLEMPPRVIGHDIQYDSVRLASRLRAVDKTERSLEEAIAGSDLVVIATPVGAIPDVLLRCAQALPEGCVVTDTGSTKREIVRRAAEILPSTVSFVGGHPMTGKATAGVDQPDASIFRAATYCLCPTSSTPASAVEKVSHMVKKIGANPYFVDPEEHDGLVAGISHLPYLLATALMKVMASDNAWREMSALAAGGFDAATRAAAQQPRMFADVLATNTDNVARHLESLMAELSELKTKLIRGDPDLLEVLEVAHQQRLDWEEQRKRARTEL